MTKNGTSAKVMVVGNLTKDVVYKDGDERRSAYAIFDIAITEVVEGNDLSRFYTAFVTNVSENAKPYLVKGTKVWVFGDYSDKIDTNPNSNEQYIKRIINVKDWELRSSKKQTEETEENQEAETAETTPATEEKPTGKGRKKS